MELRVRIYNSLTRKKEGLRPRKDRRVNLFVCGPTVYDWSHIGHARTYITFDMCVKFLRMQGFDVFYLENITDIDDKIIRRAREKGVPASRIATQFTKAFRDDMKALGITAVSAYAPASKFIPQIVRQVKRLITQGYAYPTPDGSVYFRVRKDSDYGKLSRQKLGELKQFEPGEAKEDPRDFALWKGAKPGEPKWKSPWGWGRPGWHIEDTAISEHYFGPQYDIHGGGIDLVFPHHECEIAQQESASGKVPFVKYWLHTGHLTVKGTKMSKSLGNFVTIRSLLSHTSTEAFRLLVAGTHYRSPLDYTDAILLHAEAAQKKIRNFVDRLRETPVVAKGVDSVGMKKGLNEIKEKFYAALSDDFNTPKALAAIFAFMAQLSPVLSPVPDSLTSNVKETALKFFADADLILGIVGKPARKKIPPTILRLKEKRDRMRHERRYDEADRVRAELAKKGWKVMDTPEGSTLHTIDTLRK